MGLFASMVTIRLSLRFLLGCILLSAAISKWIHLQQFRRGIEEYQMFPHQAERRLHLSAFLSICIPLLELLVGIGLSTHFLLTYALMLALFLFFAFSSALTWNLLRGRHDLSCHCGGILENHSISWWMVGRNLFFMACVLFILYTPADPFTVTALFNRLSSTELTAWINTAIPILLLNVGILILLSLLKSLHTLLPGLRNP